jgi:hypothetical protein
MLWILPYCGLLWALVHASLRDDGGNGGNGGNGDNGDNGGNAPEAFIVASRDLHGAGAYRKEDEDLKSDGPGDCDGDVDDVDDTDIVQPAGLVRLMRGADVVDMIRLPVLKPTTAARRPNAGANNRPDLGAFMSKRNLEELQLACSRERT